MRKARAALPQDVKSHLVKLGENIKEARLARGWSQEDVAERALISRFTYADIESGTGTVQMHHYMMVLDVFNLSHQMGDVAAPHTDEEGRMRRLRKGGK
jgi:transcriptional regulator with XRE-family HTH domain